METTMTTATIGTETQFLDFEKARVQVLTLDQLQRTHKENDVFGKPLKGIYHYDLVNQVIGMCNDFGYHAEVYDLFTAQNKDRNTPGVVLLPEVEAVKGQRAIEAHILRRVFANIRLTDFDDDANTTNLAISFHQKGIQVGFGTMVKICHNQMMLNADCYASTYSDKGNGRRSKDSEITIQGLLDIVRSWLMDARHIVVDDREKMERMKAIDVPAAQIFTIIGMLTAMRVKCDTHVKEIKTNVVYPLNQSQISTFTEDLMVRQHNFNKVTVWDLYDAATNLYKANLMDIPAMLPQNRQMVKFLDEQFQLNF